MIRSRLFWGLGWCGLVLGLAGPTLAECRQALVLGLDVSGSVDQWEYRLQLDGLARALESPEVRSAILDPPLPPVRVAVFEWSGSGSDRLVVDWSSLRTEADLMAVTATLRRTQRHLRDTRTGIGPALLYGASLLETAGPCAQRTMDISGDGRANHGVPPESVVLPGDITVNGLVVGADAPATGDTRQMQASEIVAYYNSVLVRGPNAFVETALGFEQYEDAMKRKLLRELRVLAIARLEDPAGDETAIAEHIHPVSGPAQ